MPTKGNHLWPIWMCKNYRTSCPQRAWIVFFNFALTDSVNFSFQVPAPTLPPTLLFTFLESHLCVKMPSALKTILFLLHTGLNEESAKTMAVDIVSVFLVFHLFLFMCVCQGWKSMCPHKSENQMSVLGFSFHCTLPSLWDKALNDQALAAWLD